MKWSKYTQEQTQSERRPYRRIGGRASVETNGEQMRNVGLSSVETNDEQMGNGGLASCAAQRRASPSDTNYLMANGFTKPKNQWQQSQSSGGRTDSKPETKKGKKFHFQPRERVGMCAAKLPIWQLRLLSWRYGNLAFRRSWQCPGGTEDPVRPVG
jgi:hypothetical protein